MKKSGYSSKAAGSSRHTNGVVGSGWLSTTRYAGEWPPGTLLSMMARLRLG
jgi:hypothetical protein